MAKVGAQRASELTGVSKSTIQRAMNAGKLSYELDGKDRRLIDVSELERVFGLKPQNENNASASQVGASASSAMELELEKARHALELEKVRMELRMVQEQLDNAQSQIEDLKVQRDLWQKQAQQILITSQYSQKQSEERITEMQQREEARKQAAARARGATTTAQAQPIRPQSSPQKVQNAEVTNRPIQGNATSVGPQSQAQQQNQAPIFRTMQAGNQNRTAEPAPKQSLFASLFGGNKKRTGTN